MNSSPVNCKRPQPVIVITDIGGDIDDTFALFTLMGCPDLSIRAIVTSLNDGVRRAAVAQGWMDVFRVHGALVLPTVDANNPAASITVPTIFEKYIRTLPDPTDESLQKLIDLCRSIVLEERRSDLVIICIGAVTPLAKALQADKQGFIIKACKKAYFQGNFLVPGANDGICADSVAFNFRNDMNAANYVLTALTTNKRPVLLLGKQAAYKVSITKADVANFAEILLSRMDGLNLTLMLKIQMNRFRKANPDLFHRIYHIPQKFHADLDSLEWFDTLQFDDCASHPYDPLVMLAVIAQETDCLTRPNELFNIEEIVLNNGAIVQGIGNGTSDGIYDEANVHDALVGLIQRGLSSINTEGIL